MGRYLPDSTCQQIPAASNRRYLLVAITRGGKCSSFVQYFPIVICGNTVCVTYIFFLTVDITNCTRDWPTQRDHWLVADNEWKHVTRNCSLLGDRLPDVTFNMGDPPIQQWRDISSDYLNELNKWLESAASLHIPGIPSSVSFHETDPEDLWGKVKEFVDDVMDKWYEHVGKPNKLERSAPSGQCANKQVEEWVHSRDDGEELQEEYEEEFNGRCDAR